MKEPKPKFCLICGDQFNPLKSTDKVCSRQCGYVLLGQKEIDKKVKAMKAKLKEDNVFKNLQIKINKIVRLIDRGHPCISSGKPYGKYTVHAGHFHGTQAHPAIRYNLLNIYAQADFDNTYKSGNYVAYYKNLWSTFGEDVADEISDLPLKYKTLKLSKPEAKEACLKANQIIKALESIDRMFTTKERISVRKEFNKTLGIYK